MFRKPFAQFAIALMLVVFAGAGYAAGVPESCKEYAKIRVMLCRKGYPLAHDSDRKTPI
jgi:hypothetical protein